jgi:hypothetical protein
LGDAEAGTAVVNTAAFRELAIARGKIAAMSRAWDDISRLGGRITSGSLGDIQRNIEVRFLDGATKNELTAEALAVHLAIKNGDHTLTGASSAHKASIWVIIEELAALRFVLNT